VTEAFVQTKVKASYTLDKLFVRVISNNCNGDTIITSRKNAAGGNQSVTIGASSSGVFEDNTNSDSVVDGDYLNSKIVCGGTSGTIDISLITYVLTGDEDPIIQAANGTLSHTGSSDCILGHLIPDFGTLEVDKAYRFRTAVTLSHLRIYVATNTATGVGVCQFRKNLANGNMVISIGAGLTGEFEDNVNTDVMDVGDGGGMYVNNDGSGEFEYSILTMKSTSAVRPFGEYSEYRITNANTTEYYTLEGSSDFPTNTELRAQMKPRVDVTIQKLYWTIGYNYCEQDSSLFLRVNGANGNLGIIVGAGLSGAFEDLINSDNVNADDLIDWQVVTGASGQLIHMVVAAEQVSTPEVVAHRRGFINFQDPGIL